MPFSFRDPFFSGLLAASLLVAGVPVVADDWPQFLGPNRNGVYLGPPLAKSWPAAGPRVVWGKRVGQGFADPVVAGTRLTLFHRVADGHRRSDLRVRYIWHRSGGPACAGKPARRALVIGRRAIESLRLERVLQGAFVRVPRTAGVQPELPLCGVEHRRRQVERGPVSCRLASARWRSAAHHA